MDKQYYNFDQVKRQAKGRWPDILVSLTKMNWDQCRNVHQPCPNCGGKDRYRFDNKDNDGTYLCSHCGAGDGWDMLKKLNNWEFKEAVPHVAKYLSITPEPPKEAPKPVAKVLVNPIFPVPANVPKLVVNGVACIYNPRSESDDKNKKYQPEFCWEWRNSENQRIGYIIRYRFNDKKTGDLKKIVQQVLWCETPEGTKWAFGSIPDKRPLFNIETVKPTDETVLIVEGEKTCKAAESIFKGLPVVTFVGGAHQPHLSDWSSLYGKKILIWPDNDDEGFNAVNGYVNKRGEFKPGIWHFLNEFVPKLKVVKPPANKPEHWDLADAKDEKMTREQLLEHIKSNAFDATPVINKQQPQKQQAPLPLVTTAPAPVKPKEPEKKTTPVPPKKNNGPWYLNVPKEEVIRPLGVDYDCCYYLPGKQLQVRKLRFNSHKELDLLGLAPMGFWAAHFTVPDKEAISWKAAANWLIESCQNKGIYDPDNVRGRGCWWDNGRVIMHLGDKLLVDNELKEISSFKTEYIYQKAVKITAPIAEPLSKSEVTLIEDAANMISWEVPASAALFLGWLALAPICGALRWRPHIWITGSQGSGKSTVLRDFAMTLLSSFRLAIQNDSSEAGIRQKLSCDAIPVIFDEFETKDRDDQRRVQKNLSLMRQASTETGMVTLKGTTTHSAIQFNIRSMFLLSSISVGVKEKADESRISILGIRARLRRSEEEKATAENLDKCLKSVLGQFNEQFSRRFIARMVRLIPIIRQNAEVFSEAISLQFGSKRLGDQYGFLLAGAYSYQSEETISIDIAKAYINELDWNEYTEVLEQSQEEKALRTILQSYLVVNTNWGTKRITIGEALVRLSKPFHEGSKDHYNENDLETELRNYGILYRLNEKRIYIANNADNLARLLADSYAAQNWNKMLHRLEGAEIPSKTMYFGPAVGTQRCVSLPDSYIFEAKI